MANPKSPAWYTQGVSGPTFDQPGIGSIFYVDGSNGDDTNSGLLPDVPVLTITQAIALCTAGANDYIIVLGYPGAAAGETWPIAMSKSKVHLIGTVSQAAPSPFINAPADTDCVTVSASNCEIAGLEFSCGATGACITVSGLTWKTNIHDNWLGWQDVGQDGIRLSAGTDDTPHTMIRNNWFGEKLTRDGIRVTFNSTRSVVKDNVFLGVASGAIGINIVNTMANGMLLNNVFGVADAATGEAITFAATATDGVLVCDNRTMQGNTAMGNVPYRDLGSNHFGLNYYGLLAIMPVTV